MMDAQMQVLSKQKIDEFPSSRTKWQMVPGLVMWAHNQNFIGSTTDNIAKGAQMIKTKQEKKKSTQAQVYMII